MSTPDQTDQEFFTALNRVDGGVQFAIAELIRRLTVQIPLKTSLMNSTLGLTDNRAITLPVKFGIAPGVMTDSFVNGIYVGYESDLEMRGPGIAVTKASIIVYSIGSRMSAPMLQTADHGYREAIIKGVMYSWLNGCVDESDNNLWTNLLPVQTYWIPEPYVEYSGVAVHFNMMIAPGANRWTSLSE